MKVLRLSTLAAIALVSTVAMAGFTQPAPVTIDLVNGIASGDMATARVADNDVEYIGCGVRRFDDGAGAEFSFGFCQARDADEVQLTCFTQTESLLETMRATSDYSFVTFSWVDDGNDGFECIRVGFSTQSFYLPKPKK